MLGLAWRPHPALSETNLQITWPSLLFKPISEGNLQQHMEY